MLGTPIWPNMRVPGPRLKNPSAIPVDVYHGYQLRSAIARTLEPQVRTKHFANFPKTIDCYAQLIFCFQSLEV